MKIKTLRTLTGCLLAFTLGAQAPASAQDTSGALTDIVNLTGDFYESPWLGTFKLNTEAEGWVWHVDHGWLFAEPFESDGLYLFDPVIPGWFYSERGLYPYIYVGSGEWIYFDEMDMGPGNHPRTFYSFESETNFYLPMVGLPNLVQTAGDAGIFETLLLAATTAGLAETLAEDGPFTVFAPTDHAFAALGSETIDDLLDDPETLADMLLYHVLPGKIFSRDVSSGWFTAANGADIRIVADEGGVTLNGSSSVIEVDIGASNGVIHVIDTVLLPPDETFVIGFDSGAFQYTINGETGPNLEMTRGETYLFTRSDFSGHPFALSTEAPGTSWQSDDLYGDEILNSPSGFFYTPSESTPDMLYYRCTVHASMGAGITVVDPESDYSDAGGGGSYGY